MCVCLLTNDARALPEDPPPIDCLTGYEPPEGDFAPSTTERAGSSEDWQAFAPSPVPAPPLLWLSADRSFAMGAMLYWRNYDLEQRTRWRMLWPLYGERCTRDATTRITPLWGERRTRGGRVTGLAGPYYYRRDGKRSTDLLFPLFARRVDGRQRRMRILTVYDRRSPRRHDGGIAPLLFWGGHRERQSRYFVLAPALLHYRSPSRRAFVLGPVYRFAHDDSRRVGVFPLYMGKRSTDQARHISPLLFWSFRRDERFHLTLPGLLTHYARFEQGHDFISPLVFSHRHGGRRRLTVLPLWWQRDNPDRKVRVGFPVWWQVQRPDSRVTVLAPFGFRVEDADERTTVALNAAYTRRKKSDGWSFHLFPLLSLASYHPDHFKWQLLTGLVGRERDAEKQRWRAAWAWTRPKAR